jgi:hypothetical protein
MNKYPHIEHFMKGDSLSETKKCCGLNSYNYKHSGYTKYSFLYYREMTEENRDIIVDENLIALFQLYPKGQNPAALKRKSESDWTEQTLLDRKHRGY